ncbi:hypothetical protein DYB25_012031 [Aphanomyces astaci]|uniref:Uncharacterized protein n=1 Tax=Aphanomyces astaci TaxID=112090 RepID=A0A397A7R6_APHAT|nr:hypothetical protein DYB25_012031 [Aphanomyces astaci]
MSVDTDESTSDTLAIVSSDQIPFDVDDTDAFRAALYDVCAGLCEDIVRNGEGAHHVMRVVVTGAADEMQAKGVGKSIVNSPLLKCAVAGNDPNVGRLVMAVCSQDVEKELVQHMKKAQLTETTRGGVDHTSRDYPPHDHMVEIQVDLGLGNATAKVLGIDLTHEYVAINADYRS